MICIGTIIKSHKTSGQFLCQLFSPILIDAQGQHRLSNLRYIELRPPTKRSLGQRQQADTKSLRLQVEDLQLIGQAYKLLLKSPVWDSPEQIKPFHLWELWVDDSYACPCEENEFLYCELVGAEVYAKCAQQEGGEEQYLLLGHVIGLLDGPCQLILEIRPSVARYPQCSILYLPFDNSVIGQIERGKNIEIFDLEYFESLL